MQLNENEERVIRELFAKVTNYYKEYMNTSDENDLPEQNMIEDVSACFRIICQVVESFLVGYKQLQHQYQLLEQKLIDSEQEVRNHIRLVQELKLLGENLYEKNCHIDQQLKNSKLQILTLEREISQYKKKKLCTSQERLTTETTQDRQDRQDRMLSLLSSQKSRQQLSKKSKMKRQNSDVNTTTCKQQNPAQFLNQTLSKALKSGIITQKKKKPIKMSKQNQVSLKIRNERCLSQQERYKTQGDQSFYY